MNIWLLNRYYYPHVGGIESSIYNISLSLHDLGHDVYIFTQDVGTGNEIRHETATFFKFNYQESLIMKAAFWLKAKKRIEVAQQLYEKAVKQFGKPDVVISRDPLMCWAFMNKYGNESITYVPPGVFFYNKVQRANVSSLFHYFVLKTNHYIDRKYQERCFRNLDKIVVFSDNVKKQILKRMNSVCGKIEVIHPGCNPIFASVAKNYCYNPQVTSFVFVGRLVEDKNLLMLLESIKSINNRLCTFTIVGDGMQRSLLEDYVKEHNLSNVIFVGATNHPEKYYPHCDYFILPSQYESFGQVITESLSCGTPVIGFKTIRGYTLTAVDELIQDGKNGFIMDCFDVSCIIATIEKAIDYKNNKDKYLSMREFAHKNAVQDYNWKTFANKCIDSIREGLV